MNFWRGLLLVVLGLGVAGFGLCSLCGGVMGLSTLSEKTRNSGEYAMLMFTFSGIGAVLTWLCWWGYRKLRAKPAAASSPTDTIDAA